MKLLLALVAALAACGSARPPPAAPEKPAAPRQMAGDPTCPLLVPGTSVKYEDTSDGAALVFVTTGDIAEVRKRADALVKMYEQQHGKLGGTVDVDGTPPEQAAMDRDSHVMENHDMGLTPLGAMIEAPGTAEVSNVDNGARVAFKAKADGVVKLQEEVRRHAQHLTAGSCKMAM